MNSHGKDIKIFTLNSNKAVAHGIADCLGLSLGKSDCATFSDGESTNLCFKDREGVQGLNRYHTDKLARLCNSQTLTLDLHLTTAETASLFTADGTIPSLRTKFRFTIQGESSLFRLAKIESWNTDEATLHCTFERELKD